MVGRDGSTDISPIRLAGRAGAMGVKCIRIDYWIKRSPIVVVVADTMRRCDLDEWQGNGGDEGTSGTKARWIGYEVKGDALRRGRLCSEHRVSSHQVTRFPGRRHPSSH